MMDRRRALMAIGSRPYRFVEYIENAGDSNSWIELDVVPSNTFGYKANISITQRTNSVFVFGTREIDAGRLAFGATENKKTYIGWGAYSSTANNAPTVEWGTMETVKCNYKNDRKAYVNSTDIWQGDLPALGFTPTWNWIVLGYKSASGAITGRQCKIYKEGIEITSGSAVIRDLRPCYRLSDNAIGLLDVIHNVFYGNSGTGNLVKGADL